MIEVYKGLSQNDCYNSQQFIFEKILILIKNNHNKTKANYIYDNDNDNENYVFDNEQVLYEINRLIYLIKNNYSSLTYNLNTINEFLKNYNYKIIYNYTHDCYLFIKNDF